MSFDFDTGNSGSEGPWLQWTARGTTDGAIGARQFLDSAVLRKQPNRRAWVRPLLGFQVFHERETGALKGLCGFLGAFVGPLHKLLNCTLHPTHHQCRHRLVDHVQRASHLVKLLARHAQRTGVHRPQIDAARRIGFTRKTLERLAGRFDRPAGFVQHPGQRPQIPDGRRATVAHFGCGTHHHDVVHSSSSLVQARAGT